MSHISPIWRENCRPGNRGHCNQVTETGKVIWECGATWRIWLNSLTCINPTYDTHTKFHGDLICHFDVMIGALLQDYRKMTYPMWIWGWGLLYYYICPQQSDVHIKRWSVNNAVGLGFPIFFPAAVCLSCKLRVASLLLAYLKTTCPNHICISPWLFSQPHQIWGEYSQLVRDKHYCFLQDRIPSKGLRERQG